MLLTSLTFGAKLEVNGDIALQNCMAVTLLETYGGKRAGIRFKCNELLCNIGGASEAMRIDSSGNVGINTVPTRLTQMLTCLNIKAD